MNMIEYTFVHIDTGYEIYLRRYNKYDIITLINLSNE